ncbi:hypothetical protein [Bifidobacterium callitrichidarum]|uniref:Uncharacterized protein n=1 Tax=Bifidobacterium callitrichidarum TaxID=2052941 RepID=A0A2U2NCA0_9BIFI|nr:hypothetical protein [Bifidobacterium callitrichidarum]PWG66629.1 hypothetical protein DF196_01635 [Bifidobacterium callitrichidarum]
MIPPDDVRKILQWIIVTTLILSAKDWLVDSVGPAGMFAICLTVGFIGIGIAVDTMTHANDNER